MKGFLDYIIDSILAMFKALVKDLYEVFQDVCFFIFEQVISLAVWGMSLITGEFTSVNLDSQWAKVPQIGLQFMDYLHIADCVGMIVSALIVRFVLNFVPFVR